MPKRWLCLRRHALIGGISIVEENIGEVLLPEGKYDEAIKYLNEALIINLKQDNKDGISQIYSDLGLCYLYKKHNVTALNYLQQALNLGIANQLDGDRAEALTAIAQYL
ncbi:tetratricopeptide repeat protein [Mucilaginibacter sp.]